MGELVDSWALKWLESRRELGKKGLILEKRSGSNQVRWQKISWNKETKKRDREVVYLGTLDFPGHLVLSKSLDLRAVRPEALDAAGIQLPPAPATFTINDQKCTGVMRLISAVSEDLMEALDRAFPKQIRDDLMMLVVARLAKSGRLVRAGGWFLRQENCMGLNPHVDPDNLSKTLEAVGSSPTAQQTFFDALPQSGRLMAADMTVCFSRSKGAFIIKRGYNRFKLTCGQFNIVIVCSIEDSLPQCMKTVAGNIRENSILGMLSEYGLGTDVILVMDRGYSDDGVLNALDEAGYKFVVPLDKNSRAYDTIPLGEGAFLFRGDAVTFGHGTHNGWLAYRYENLSSKNDDLAKRIDDADGIILGPISGNIGNMILVTNVNESAREVYRMFKTRGAVEQAIDTAKNGLEADSTYMRTDETIVGYNFVTFLALRMHMTIDGLLTGEGVDPKMTVDDVLDLYACANMSESDRHEIGSYIPPDLRRLDAQLGLNVYP